MKKQATAIKKLRAIVLPETKNTADVQMLAQIQVEAMKLGFMFTERAANALALNIKSYSEIFSALQELVGANKKWKPFYANFPQQVMEMTDCELFINAIVHYWTRGEWRPSYQETTRMPVFEPVNFKMIDLIDEKRFMGIFTSLLGSNGSLTPADREVINDFMLEYGEAALLPYVPEKIPFKETLCQFVGSAFELGYTELAKVGVKTTTDVLRVACHLSKGDLTLVKNTKFKLTNAQRRFIVSLLEPVVSEEDVARYEGQWVNLFHCIHIGKFNAPKSIAIAKLAREGKCKSFNSRVEIAIRNKNGRELVDLLAKRGGDFARRLDDVLRDFPKQADEIVTRFLDAAYKADTRLLLQVMNHFFYRNKRNNRIVIPKGNVAKATVLWDIMPAIGNDHIDRIVNGIKFILEERFSLLPKLGKVYVDPSLMNAPVQLSMRTASDGLLVLQRGTRIPLGDKDILRFFINWEGSDIDLSAAFMDENLNFHSTIAYYNLRSGYNSGNQAGYNAIHSGDITWAPAGSGACEFIDIDLNSITDKKIRYVAMDVRVYSGAGFKAQKANAGWMMRTEIGSRGETFDARTVEQRIALETNSKQCLVALFDIRNREVIWLDLVGSSSGMYGGNNVHSNLASIRDMATAAIELKQPLLYDLFVMHAENRGELVENRDEADVVFDSDMILKYDQVLSEYVV